MSQLKTYIAILLALVLTSFGLSSTALLNQGPRNEGISLNTLEPTPQAFKIRFWKSDVFERSLTLGGGEKGILYNPVELRVAEDHSVFVLDIGSYEVKKFNQDGNLVQKFGLGRGQGPGEFTAPTDFTVDELGRIWVSDPLNGRVTVFETSGEVSRIIPIEETPYRIALLGTNEFVAMLTPMREFIFRRFDNLGVEKGKFGAFLKNQSKNGLALDGWIRTDSKGRMFYAAMYSGFLASYSPDGNLEFLVETIEPAPFPKMIVTKGKRWVDRSARLATYGISVDGDTVFMISTIRQEINQRGVIDAYDAIDGKYLYSRKLPEHCNHIFVTKDALFTVREAIVTRWDLQP